MSYKPGSRCTIRYELEYAGSAHSSTRSPQLIHRLTVLLPEFEGSILPLLQRLEHLAAIYTEERAVPTHGTFNPEQVLIDGERIGFIDFDDYCMAEPALDVGLFRSAIKDTGMNAPFPSANPSREERLARLRLLDTFGDVFLSEYEAHATVSRHRVALWEATDYLRNCVHYWIKVKPAEPDTALLVLEQHLQKCEKNRVLELSDSCIAQERCAQEAIEKLYQETDFICLDLHPTGKNIVKEIKCLP